MSSSFGCRLECLGSFRVFVHGVWWSVAAAELLGVVLSVVLLVLMRRRYHYA